MAERNTAISGQQIKAAVAADGLQKDASENLAVDVSDFAGSGLEDDGSENLQVVAGDGIDVSTDVAVDVTDFIDTTKGLTETSNDIQVNITADEGLDFNGGTGALEVDVTDFIDTAAGLTESSNNIQVNLGTDAGLDFNTGAIEVDVTDIIDTNSGLTESGGDIQVNIDTSYLEFATGAISIKDDSIPEVKLDIFNAPVDGYFLKYTTANGLEWADVASGYVELTDIIANEIPSGTINGANTDFTVANSIASGTLQVMLNGLQQEPGSGNDYTLSGTTVTFAVAPETGDILLVNYVKA